MRLKFGILLVLSLVAPVTANAQQAPQSISTPADSAWRHAGSGAVLPAAIEGYPRDGVFDLGKGQIDVVLQYRRDGDTQITVFLFRPAVNSGPLWFDRSETIINTRDIYGNAVPAGPLALFALPGSNVQTGMRRSYKPQGGRYAGTGVALVPFGEWMISIRISSTKLDPAAVDALLIKSIAAIGWPSGATAPAAVAIEPCPSPLTFGKAERLKSNGGSALFGGLMAGAGDKKMPVPDYCREGAGDLHVGIYRFVGTDSGYTIAFNDAGRVVTVLPDMLGKKSEFGVTLLDLDSISTYPGYKGLPAPNDVVTMVTSIAPVSTTVRGSNTVTINAGALK